MLTATFQGAQGVDGTAEDIANMALNLLPQSFKDKVCKLLNSSGVEAAANLLSSLTSTSIAAARAKLSSFACPKTTSSGGTSSGSGGGTTPTAPAPGLSTSAKPPTGNYPAGSVYTQSPVTKQYLVYVPFSGFGGLGTVCVDDWCGSFSGGLGDPPQQVTPDQFAEILKKAGISTSQALALLGVVPWYKNWKYLVPMAVGVVAAGVGTYYIVRRKKEA